MNFAYIFWSCIIASSVTSDLIRLNFLWLEPRLESIGNARNKMTNKLYEVHWFLEFAFQNIFLGGKWPSSRPLLIGTWLLCVILLFSKGQELQFICCYGDKIASLGGLKVWKCKDTFNVRNLTLAFHLGKLKTLFICIFTIF